MLDFLCLDNFQKDHFQKVNASHGHRFEALSNLILNPPRILKPMVDAGRALARQHKGGFVDRLKHWLRVPKKRTSLSSGFRQELESYFRPGIEATSTLLKKDLSMWLQDSPNHA